MQNRLLDTKTAAALLGLSHRTLEDWRRKGKGPAFVSLGRRALYRPEDLQDFIEGHSVHSTAEAKSNGFYKLRADPVSLPKDTIRMSFPELYKVISSY